jgi:hypothetical protein
MSDERERLPMWVIYDHPPGYPLFYVGVKWLTLPQPHATNDIIFANTLDDLRNTLERKGLVCLTRSPEDDPKIIETWL